MAVSPRGHTNLKIMQQKTAQPPSARWSQTVTASRERAQNPTRPQRQQILTVPKGHKIAPGGSQNRTKPQRQQILAIPKGHKIAPGPGASEFQFRRPLRIARTQTCTLMKAHTHTHTRAQACTQGRHTHTHSRADKSNTSITSALFPCTQTSQCTSLERITLRSHKQFGRTVWLLLLILTMRPGPRNDFQTFFPSLNKTVEAKKMEMEISTFSSTRN